MKKKVISNVSWVGCIDWDLTKFHGDDFSIDNGSSQNSYLIEEEKTVLIDTVWTPNRCDFIGNLKKEIDLNKIDMVVVNHAENDHSGALPCLMQKLKKDTPIYCSAVCKNILEGQYGKKDWNFKLVKTGDEVEIGNGKKLKFLDMKMLHWPDSMATFLTKDNVLFSNDAFGQHFAVEELFADKANFEILNREALKYFVNILNPFSLILSKKLKEIAELNLPIEIIAPSHGAIWRKEPSYIIKKYEEWANCYKENQITVLFDSMWGGTKKLAQNIAKEIFFKDKDVVVKVYNISKADKNDVMVEVFKSKAIFVGSPTVCNSITSNMAGFLEFLKQLKFRGKKAAVFGCYGWSGEGVKILHEKLKEAGFDVSDNMLSCLWNPFEEDFSKLAEFVESVF